MNDDQRWMRHAVALAHRSPASASAFAVGAVIAAPDGTLIAEGWSRDTDPLIHAEESALAKAAAGPRKAGPRKADPREADPREADPREAVLGKAAPHKAGLRDATLYSTLEPCSKRAHRPDATCTALILAAGIRRVVIAWREPDTFVTCEGVALLIAAGVEVVELPEFAAAARAVNAHLPGV